MADEPQLNLEGDKGGEAAAPTTFALADLTAAGIPETFIKDGKFDAQSVAASLTELGTLKTAADERAKGVPADGKYDFGLPKDWKAPEGLELPSGFEWNAPAELTARFAERAKAMGMTQADVSQFVSDWAAGDLAKKITAAKAAGDADTKAQEALKADAVKVLGPNYTDVVATTRNAMQALFVEKIGKEAGENLAKNIGFQTAADVKAFGDFINALAPKQAANIGAGAGIHSQATKLVGTPGGGRKLLDMANSKAGN